MKFASLFLVLLTLQFQTLAHAFTVADMDRTIPDARTRYAGLREFKMVLNGVLYRGGGPGGKVALNNNQLTALCEDGFTDAGYLYPDGFSGPSSTRCSQGHIAYDKFGFLGAAGAEGFLRHLHQVIQNGGRMFVHCWNGWHASGEVAAYALVQFCDFTGNEAGDYWERNVGDKARISRIRKFVKIPNLDISASDKARICPSR